MIKRILTLGVAAMAHLALPAAASAQAYDPYPAAPGACFLSPNVFSGISPTSCWGFVEKNAMDFGTGYTLQSTDDAYKALSYFGFTPGTVLEKIGSWNGASNFATYMTGLTVIGLHWGNYPNDLDNGRDEGNVSAFYLFDAGAGTNNVALADLQGISNAAVLYTGGGGGGGGECTQPGGCVVPEPNSYILMASGLAGLGYLARRRRTNA